jgi:hypothetical protein
MKMKGKEFLQVYKIWNIGRKLCHKRTLHGKMPEILSTIM